MTDTKNPASSVLIIDDDSNLCEWALFHLGGENCDVDYFTDATAGLAALRPGSPDVVILDLDSPDMPGLQVLERIKKIYPKLPVIMLTATEDGPIVVQAMNSGAFDYLTKPVSVQRLRLVVRNAVEQHQLQRKIEDLQRTAEDAGTWGLVGRSPVMCASVRAPNNARSPSKSPTLCRRNSSSKRSPSFMTPFSSRTTVFSRDQAIIHRIRSPVAGSRSLGVSPKGEGEDGEVVGVGTEL